MAQVIKGLQDHELPDDVARCGGLTFNEVGNMAKTLMTIPCGGPFPTYAGFAERCVFGN